MIVLEENFKSKLPDATYIALGSFDGVHLGHISLIKRAVKLGKISNCKSMVCTFTNHPKSVINPDLAPKLICDNETKNDIFRKLGIDIVNYMSFNEDFMKISPEDFIKNMIYYYNIKGFIVGFNYRFGYKNLGDVSLLKKLSMKYNFSLQVMKPVTCQNEIISSSRIRQLISDGNVNKANSMLFQPFMLKGKIIHGKQIGRTLGFPTINLDYDKKYILPKGGVYFSIVEYENIKYRGISNIGYNPTVHGGKLSVETHILNFDKDIYDKDVKIYFIKKIRDEKKFDNLDGLILQLQKDKQFASKQNINM